jgi:hypothetical protein
MLANLTNISLLVIPPNVDALTLVIIIVIGILLALILWNGGAFILKAWFIIACGLGAMHFWQTDQLIGVVLLAIAGLAFLVLVIEPAHKKGH